MSLSTRIFLDSGDPAQTKEADFLLKSIRLPGVQGQTTNPSLIAKQAKHVLGEGKSKLREPAALDFYKKTVSEIAEVTRGPISIQVIADGQTTAADMLTQARDRRLWIPNAVVKFPCTTEGLKAASEFCLEGPVNITLVFSQEQAAAVYAATKRRGVDPETDLPYDVFVSPFVGRLDDIGEKGMDTAANIIEMYREFSNNHVKVLISSLRTVEHLLYSLWLKTDAITVPFNLLRHWIELGHPLPPEDYLYDTPGLTEIPFKEFFADANWTDFNLAHDLTASGLKKFYEDWKSIVSS